METKNVTIHISEPLWHACKVTAVEKKETLTLWVTQALMDALTRDAQALANMVRRAERESD